MRKLTLFVVATIALLHVHNTVGQKYYMNFAFNNNNPEGESNVENESGKQLGTASNEASSGTGSGAVAESGEDGSDGNNDNNSNMPSNSDENSNGGDTSAPSGSDGADKSIDDSATNNDESENLPMNPGDGTDDDDDDSDSMDGRAPVPENENDDGEKGGDHSHHSSYEISIDDSFGGRYVRSIYESSESHGHSGSRAGSGSRGNDIKESSESGQNIDKEKKVQNRFGDQEYEEYIESGEEYH